MIVTIAGETTEISTEGGRTTQQVADDIASAINKARVKVNKNRMNPNKREDEQNEPVDYSQK